MSDCDLIPFGLAFLGGFGGLLATLAYRGTVDSLNDERPADDQIPVFLGSRSDFRAHWNLIEKHGFLYQQKLVSEFRRRHPRSGLCMWYVAGLLWLFSLIAVALFILARSVKGWT